ncbi:MAG: peptidase S41, partial [Lactobacillus iners]|nr:peptidase S41 [Lactobacillus iners]
MKKKLSEYKYLFIVGLIGIFLGCISTYSAMTIYQQKSPLGKINNFYQKLKKTYYCDISDKRLISGAIDGMLN